MTTVGTPPDRTAPSPPAEAGRKRPRNEGGDLCAASAKSGRGGGENEGPENEGPENGPGAGQGQGQGSVRRSPGDAAPSSSPTSASPPDWEEQPASDRAWDAKYAALRSAAEAVGHADVPSLRAQLARMEAGGRKGAVPSSVTPRHPFERLVAWSDEQRVHRILRVGGLRSRMTDRREKMLEAIGFTWIHRGGRGGGGTAAVDASERARLERRAEAVHARWIMRRIPPDVLRADVLRAVRRARVEHGLLGEPAVATLGSRFVCQEADGTYYLLSYLELGEAELLAGEGGGEGNGGVPMVGFGFESGSGSGSGSGSESGGDLYGAADVDAGAAQP